MKAVFHSFGLVCLLLIGCSESSKQKNEPDNALHISIGASPQSLDPHVIMGVPASKVVENLVEPLFEINPATFEAEPAAAVSWSVSDDGLVYQFKLRQDAHWSNGDPVLAKHYVDSWQRALHPAVGWHYANDFYFLVGAKAFNSGSNPDPSSIGVVAVDDYTLEFRLEYAVPTFVKQVSTNKTPPLHRDSIEKIGDFFDISTNWASAGNYVGNGAFVLEQWDLNKVIILKKNPFYWDKDNIKLDAVYAYPIETESAEERAFRSGQVQVAYGGRIPIDKIATYQKDNPEELKITAGFATYFYVFNTTKPPFDDVRVRKALAHAIDRDIIVKNVTKAGEVIAKTLNPPMAGHYSEVTPLEYDVELGKKLLAEAGYPDGEGFPVVELVYNTADVHRKIALVIQQMWKQNLGIDITLQNEEWKVFLENRKNLLFTVARAGSSSTIGDPQDFLDSYRPGHGMNDTGWANDEYDQVLEQAGKTLDNAERYDLLAQAENILLDQMPLIPIFHYSHTHLVKKEVKDFFPNALSRMRLKGVYIENNHDTNL